MRFHQGHQRFVEPIEHRDSDAGRFCTQPTQPVSVGEQFAVGQVRLLMRGRQSLNDFAARPNG